MSARDGSALRVVVRRPGGYEQLRLERVPVPAPGPGEVAVDVAAAGVNYADCVVRMGLYASAKKYVGWPITPGFELEGVVAAVGPGVSDLAPGARVLGVTRFGGYSTRVVVPRAQLFAPPEGYAAPLGAVFPAVGLTAYYALHELAQPPAGSSVLVHSAAGGVGTALVRLARAAGNRVVGVVGAPHKVAYARAAGAHEVLVAAPGALWPAARRLAPEGYAAVFDANGASTLRQSYAHLASPGRLVVYGFHSMLPRQGGRPSYVRLALDWLRTPRFDPFAMTGENRAVLGFNLSYLFERRELLERGMTALRALARDGALPPPPVRSYALDEVAAAHRDLESGQTVGKLLLRMPRAD